MNPKKKCPRCGKIKRTKCFTFNKVLKEELCLMCDKKVGHNIFYNPESKGRIGKYSLTDNERSYLARKKGWKRVNESCKGLRTIRKRKKKEDKEMRRQKKISEIKSKETQKKFLEGLNGFK
jgi:hypothetical protein